MVCVCCGLFGSLKSRAFEVNEVYLAIIRTEKISGFPDEEKEVVVYLLGDVLFSSIGMEDNYFNIRKNHLEDDSSYSRPFNRENAKHLILKSSEGWYYMKLYSNMRMGGYEVEIAKLTRDEYQLDRFYLNQREWRTALISRENKFQRVLELSFLHRQEKVGNLISQNFSSLKNDLQLHDFISQYGSPSSVSSSFNEEEYTVLFYDSYEDDGKLCNIGAFYFIGGLLHSSEILEIELPRKRDVGK